MQETIELTSSVADVVSTSTDLVSTGGELSRFAKYSQSAQQFAADNPVAATAIGIVAAVGVGYLAYKGVSYVAGKCSGENTDTGVIWSNTSFH